MFTVYPNLRRYIKQTGVSWFDVAAAVGIDIFTLHLKMFGIRRWSLSDGIKLCAFFRTPDIEHLFVRNHSKQQ